MGLTSETEGTARQGCGNDSFEVFGFLAFGLYLLNLVMNMKRRKRSADQCSSDFDPSREPELMEGVLAFYSMFQGFLTAFYDGEDPGCRSLALCQAARDASELGKVGRTVAKAASHNAAGWLSSKYPESEEDLETAGQLGSEGRDCIQLYECQSGNRRKGFFSLHVQFCNMTLMN